MAKPMAQMSGPPNSFIMSSYRPPPQMAFWEPSFVVTISKAVLV